MKIPEWFSEATSPCSCCSVGGKNKNFVEKTLMQISKAMERSIFSEKYVSLDGFLQKIDPRVKMLTMLFLIVVSSFIKKTEILLTIYALTLLFAYVSKIELKFFIKRVWLFIPIFSGIIALPSIFNIVTPGEPLITLIHFDPINISGLSFTEISITKPGISGAILFVTRIATSVSLVVLLTLTTKWNELMSSLRTIGVPQIFVLVLSMTYQYIFILLRTIQEMYFAKKSRTINSKKHGLKKEQNWIASRIGMVFMKSYKMSDEIHSAMISRGFSGDIKSNKTSNIQNIDIAWMIFSSLFVVSILWVNL